MNKTGDGERDARIRSPKQQDALIRAIFEIAGKFLRQYQNCLPITDDKNLEKIIRDFFDLYDARPIRDNTGGTKFNDSLWIYLIAHSLAPRFIIESGTHQGHSAWLLRQACPDADMHCFDISLQHLIHRESNIHYHEMDWSEFDIQAAGADESLCYFDDHTNQARRIREAYERGFRILLFDDNRSASTLYGTGGPPVPTIDMLFDDSLEFGETIEWQRHGKRYQYVYQRDDILGARELIEFHATTPDLAQITRYRPQSGMTLVKLIP